MLDAMKTHETLRKQREKLGRYEKLCMTNGKFWEIEKVRTM